METVEVIDVESFGGRCLLSSSKFFGLNFNDYERAKTSRSRTIATPLLSFDAV